MKKILFSLAVMVSLLFCTLTASAALSGDVNGDGKTDTHDAIACLTAVTNGDTSERFDVNGDKAVDVLDAIAVVKEMKDVFGFLETPKVTAGAADGYDHLTVKPAKTGTVYYYYTNFDDVPSAANAFWSAYAGSSQFGYVSVSEGITVSHVMSPTCFVEEYKYVVLMLMPTDGSAAIPQLVDVDRKGDPSGFSVAPKVTTNASSSYDYLTGTPAVTGTIYYYYTDTSTAPATAADFLDAFNNISSSEPTRIGVVTAIAGLAISHVLKPASLVSGYNYVVLLLSPSDGSAATPQILSRNGSTVGTSAFTGTPIHTMENNTEYLTATPIQSGTLYWYYINSSSLFPASGDAAYTNWLNSSDTLRGSDSATAHYQRRYQLKYYSEVYQYSYIVAFISYNNGYTTIHTAPVLINKNNSVLTTNGFTALPSLIKQNGNDCLNGTPTVNGTIKYYYTNNPQKPSSSAFDTFYNDTMYHKGTLNAVAHTALSGINAILRSESAVSTYRYAVIRLETADGIKYDPVLLNRPVAVAGTGFTVAPSYALYNGTTDSVYATPSVTGKLYWYYTTSSTAPSRVDYNGYYTAAGLKSYHTVYSASYQPVYMKPVAERSGYSYIVFQMEDASGNRYDPVLLSINVSNGSTGFQLGPNWSSDGTHDRIGGYTVSTGGKLHFYYTSDAYTPTSVDAFNTAYTNAVVKSWLVLNSVTFDVPLMQTATVSTYPHVVVMYEDPDGIKYQPVLLNRQSLVSGTGFASDNMPFTFASSDANTSVTLRVKPLQTCRVAYYLADSAAVTNFDTGYAASPVKDIESAVANQFQNIYLGTAASLAPYTHVIIRVQNGEGTNFYQHFAIALNKVPGAAS